MAGAFENIGWFVGGVTAGVGGGLVRGAEGAFYGGYAGAAVGAAVGTGAAVATTGGAAIPVATPAGAVAGLGAGAAVGGGYGAWEGVKEGVPLGAEAGTKAGRWLDQKLASMMKGEEEAEKKEVIAPATQVCSDCPPPEDDLEEEKRRKREENLKTENEKDVSQSLDRSGKLPSNYMTKAEAQAQGWKPGTNLDQVAPGRSIGGDVFRNAEGRLPSAPGRTYFEADLNYMGGARGAERMIYSNDGMQFITRDHYRTFIPLQ